MARSNLAITQMYYIYILKCADKTLYTGITTDLKRRLFEHNATKLGAKYTSARRPVKIVYTKKFKNRSTASKEEARIKNLTRKEKEELIRDNGLKQSFAEKVYSIVKNIPKGKTLTYKKVAKMACKPKAFRAVGNVLNKNYDKTIPCHRVIRSDGKTGGYNRGRKLKVQILKAEKAIY